MSPIEWLCDKSHRFKELAQQDRDAIMHFTLLWSYFEGQALDDNSASWRQIVNLARNWEHQGRLQLSQFDEEFFHFNDRYFQNGWFTWKFENLFREDKDREALALVRPVLRGENTNDDDRIASLLLIIYRLRNKLMHGDKWDDDLSEQIDNFRHANNVLMKTLNAV